MSASGLYTIYSRVTYLGSERKLQRPDKLAVVALTNRVPTLLMRVRGGRLARYRQVDVVEVDGDII